MRYLFKGLIRDTGKQVEGHVEADSEEFAFHQLANNGIVTESLRYDPKPIEFRPAPPPAAPALVAGKPALLPPMVESAAAKAPGRATPPPPPGAGRIAPPPVPGAKGPVPEGPAGEVHSAIDNALDASGVQIDFDSLTAQYRGKKVWYLDREKIKRNVARVVDQAITTSIKTSNNVNDTREAVAEAIEKLFKDNRNITSPLGAQAATPTGPVNTAGLDRQIDRLSTVIKNFENALASMQMAIRNIGTGGGGGHVPRRHMGQAPEAGLREEQNAVLLEIFKTNMDLLRSMEDEMRQANAEPAAAAAS